MARHGDETEEFPQWVVGRRCARPSCSASRSASGGAAPASATSRPRSCSRSWPAPTCRAAILAQLIFNGPPRAIEHLGTDALRDRWLPIAASGDGLFCIGISETEAGTRGRPHARPPHARRRRLPPQRVQELRHRRAQGASRASCGAASPGATGTKGIGAVVVDLEAPGVTRHRHAREDGPARDERSRARVRRRAHRARRRAAVGRSREQRVVQDADLAHQPRTLRQRGDVHRRRAGRARVRGAVHGRAQDRRQDARRLPGPAVEDRRHGDAARRRAPAAAARGAHGRPARHAARARDRDGEDRGEPRGQVRVRRGDPAARRLRLLAASTRSSACTATSAGCASARARSRSSATSSARSVLRGATPASDGWKHAGADPPVLAADVPHAARGRVPRGRAVRGTGRRSTSC